MSTEKTIKDVYREETGKSCYNPNNEAGSNFFTDDYTEWLEQQLFTFIYGYEQEILKNGEI